MQKDDKEIRLIDLVDTIRYNKNISKKNLLRVANALPKVIKNMLCNRKEVIFENFVKLGFRTAKDRMVKTRAGEEQHMPAHLRFKAVFFSETKKYLNEEKKQA